MPTEEITYRQGVMARFDDVDKGIAALDKKVSETNGKVRKIIIALVAIGAFSVGTGMSNPTIVGLLAKFL